VDLRAVGAGQRSRADGIPAAADLAVGLAPTLP
jgi:hypothetical protein